MIEYIVRNNIDDRVLSRSARLLAEGGLLGIPSDTNWSIVCSVLSKEGIKKLRSISGERDERHFTVLCSDISQFGDFCSMDNTRFRLIKRLAPGPYVFILKTLLGTEKILQLRRSEVGVKIPDHPVPIAVINTLGSPLYSVTAKRSMAGDNSGLDWPASAETAENTEEIPPIPEEELYEGGWELEAINGLDLILDTGEERPRIFSTILDISGNEIMLLRTGAGLWPT